MAERLTSSATFYLLGLGEDQESRDVRNLAIGVVAQEERGHSDPYTRGREEARMAAAQEWRGIFTQALSETLADGSLEVDDRALPEDEQNLAIKAGVLLAALDLGIFVDTHSIPESAVSE